MKYFYPKELLANTPEGYTPLPIVADPDQPNTYRIDMDATPFSNYTDNVIHVSHPEFLQRDKVLEIKSFSLMICDKKWLYVKTPKEIRIGLLQHPVNRGEEAKEYAQGFNQLILDKEEPADKKLQIIGYFYTGAEIIFVTRMTFVSEPSFQRKDYHLIPISTEGFLDLAKEANIDPFSAQLLKEFELVGLN